METMGLQLQKNQAWQLPINPSGIVVQCVLGIKMHLGKDTKVRLQNETKLY